MLPLRPVSSMSRTFATGRCTVSSLASSSHHHSHNHLQLPSRFFSSASFSSFRPTLHQHIFTTPISSSSSVISSIPHRSFASSSSSSSSGNERLTFDIVQAIRLVKACHVRHFDASFDIAMKLGVDPRKPNQAVRGVAKVPHGSGKSVRVAVFAKGPKADEARKAGAEVVGDADLADKILRGEMEFDRCIATPDMMMVVGKVARILGPRGLMPNPKLGTVTTNIADAVQALRQGQIEFKAEKAGTMHASIGKCSFTDKQLYENICSFVVQVAAARPSGARGVFIRQCHVSSSQGISAELKLSEYPFKPKRLEPVNFTDTPTKITPTPTPTPTPTSPLASTLPSSSSSSDSSNAQTGASFASFKPFGSSVAAPS